MDLTCTVCRHLFQIWRRDRSLRVQYLCHLLVEFSPRVLSIFAEAVVGSFISA